MAKQRLDKETKKALLDTRKMIEDIIRQDSNEDETRKRINYAFQNIMGYNIYRDVTSEYAIRGAGNTVHCDIAVQLDHEESSKPELLVEVKKVNIDLAPKHLRQAASYAIDIGCDWVLLTNSKEWKFYHISYGKPPQTKLIASWDVIDDNLTTLAEKFALIDYKNIKRGGLARLWEKSNVLTPQNILKIILSEESIRLIRHGLKKATDVAVSPEEIVGAVRHMLNEAAVTEMEKIKISLPAKKQRKGTRASKASKENIASVEKEAEAISAAKQLEE